jgi:hypothetical protein
MPPLNEANLATQRSIALQPNPSNGNGSAAVSNGASVGSLDVQALAKSVTDAVIEAIAEKYTLIPRKA